MMNAVWSIGTDEILKIGHWLGDSGIDNWALSKAQALDAAAALVRLGVPVLGGQVFEKLDGSLKATRDTWECIRAPGESEDAYLSRSSETARNYIASIPDAYSEQLLVAIIPGADAL